MIYHVGIYVENLQSSSDFYTPLLETLGWNIIFNNDLCFAYGKNNKPFFEIYMGKAPSSPIHIAFPCTSKKQVEVFHQTALQLNAHDHGKPGYRDYFPNYYACFVIDLNGHNLEGLYFPD